MVSGDGVDPDDLVQEAFTRVLVARPEGGVRDLGAYLRRTVVNLASNERRSAARARRAWSRVGVGDGAGRADGSLPSYPSDLSDLERLSPVARGLLYLVEVEGHSFAEAARLAGCSEPAARMRVSRARRALREAIEKERRDV